MISIQKLKSEHPLKEKHEKLFGNTKGNQNKLITDIKIKFEALFTELLLLRYNWFEPFIAAFLSWSNLTMQYFSSILQLKFLSKPAWWAIIKSGDKFLIYLTDAPFFAVSG